MKTQRTYPAVSFLELIDIFHATLYWLYETKQPEWLFNNFGTFDSTFRILVELGVLHERRPTVIRQSRLCGRIFLKQVRVVQQIDERSMNEILQTELEKPFAIRISQREMVENGSLPKVEELFSRTRVHLTRRGIATAPVAERTAKRFLSQKQYLSVWQTKREHFNNLRPSQRASIIKGYRERLDEENWGVLPTPGIPSSP